MTWSPGESAGPAVPPPTVRDTDLSELADGPLSAELIGYLAFQPIEFPGMTRRSWPAFDHWLAAAAASGVTLISVLAISAPVAR